MRARYALSLLASLALGACSAADDTRVGHPPADARAPGSDGTSVDDGGDAGRRSFEDVVPMDAALPDGSALTCLTDADCANGNTCATPHCRLSGGEIGTCEYAPAADGVACSAGACPAQCRAGICRAESCADGGTEQPSIDPMCGETCPFTRMTAVFPPAVTLLPDDVPRTCTNGFQLGGANGGCGVAIYTLRSRAGVTSRAITLDVDFATYLVPDGVTVTGVDATGARYVLLRTCRLQTWDSAGPSTRRPPDESIRQFRLTLRPGTRSLEFDFGPVTSPMYMRVVGLCDFDVTPFATAQWWEAVP